jgi:hypothetical protein
MLSLRPWSKVTFAAFLILAVPSVLLARGGWTDPLTGWDYVYEANVGGDLYVAGDNVVGLLDGTWAQNTGVLDETTGLLDGTSMWDGSAPGVFNTTETDPITTYLLGPAPGGVKVICPEGQLGEDGLQLCYLLIEDVGNPTDTAVFPTRYSEPSNRKLYFYHSIDATSENGWTLMARLRLSPVAVDPNVDMTAGWNGAVASDLPMVAVHDTEEGTVGFSINDAGKLVVLSDDAAHEVNIDLPTEWVTVWLSAIERVDEGTYDLRVFIDGQTTPALTLSRVAAPISEITGSSNHWISIGSCRTGADTSLQIDYVAFKAGIYEPDRTAPCPMTMTCTVDRLAGRTVVDVDWDLLGQTFDSIDLRRDGNMIAAGLPGDTQEYLDLSPLAGSHTYEITTTKGTETCTLSCMEQMCLFDASCTYRAGATAGTVDAVLTWSNPGQLDSIEVSRVVEYVDNTGESTEILETMAGTATEFEDLAIPAADLSRIHYYVMATSGTWTCQVDCQVTTCPQQMTCNVERTGGVPAVRVSWTQYRSFESLTLNRRVLPSDTFELLQTLGGSATSYLDTTVSEFQDYEYQLVVTMAAGALAEACGSPTCRILIVPQEVGYQPPAGGWDYIFDAETGAADQYNANVGETGNLDGSWIRSSVEDFWDGSKPGDTGSPPDGNAPGGIGVVSLTASDPCKKDAVKVLLLEDVGDPTGVGYPDPSNRKMLLGRDIGGNAAGLEKNLLRDGLTFSFRLRLRPLPIDIPIVPGTNAADGDGLGKGYGMVGIHFRNPGTTETAGLGTGAGLAFALGETTADISLEPTYQIAGFRGDQFHTVWATVIDPEADNIYAVNLYLNGSTVPVSFDSALQPPSSNLTDNNPGFGAAVYNFMTIGLVNTGNDASVEIDHVAWKSGVFTPVAKSCGGPTTGFRRGDADGNGKLDLTDAISTLQFLYMGYTAPTCMDAADTDDSGKLDLTDAISSLQFQFMGGDPPAPPGSTTCGQDPTPGDPYTECTYTKC